MLRIVQGIWLSILGCGALWAQAAISGSVVNDVTGEPLKRVAITLTGGSAHDSAATLSDAQGKFRFAAVSPGKYRMTVTWKFPPVEGTVKDTNIRWWSGKLETQPFEFEMAKPAR